MLSSPGGAEFEAFVHKVEPRLRIALTAVFGQDAGRDATAAALAYGWEHWVRVSEMENPAGYLYRVGRSSQRQRREPIWHVVPEDLIHRVEPGLPAAIANLSERQRLAVVLVHAYGWERGEVAGLAGVSVSALDTHLARGMSKLRQALKVGTDA